ncbi:MAG: Antitoxin DinJ [Stenotrophomonas maltophilia]|nr:MAG: Antitoxin DinJ [Stenotrophomonas maltophilia]
MSANAVVRARIDEHIKEEATVVLAAMGLTVSDAPNAKSYTHEEVMQAIQERIDQARDKPC